MAGLDFAWAGRKVLVTGCTGFLGAAVARELLDRQALVVGLLDDRTSGSLFRHEREAGRFQIAHGRPDNLFCVYTAIAVHEVSVVLHLSSESGAPASTSVGENLYERENGVVLRAAGLRQPASPVVMARSAGELRIVGSLRPQGVARFGEIFGGGDRRGNQFVPRTIASLMAGESASVNTGASRDFVFVRDAARCCLQVAESVCMGSRADLEFRSGWELTQSEMTAALKAAVAGEEPKSPPNLLPGNLPGRDASTSFAEAIKETVEWYKSASRQTVHTAIQTNPRRRAA